MPAIRTRGLRPDFNQGIRGPGYTVGCLVCRHAIGAVVRDGSSSCDVAGRIIEVQVVPHSAKAQTMRHLMENHVVKVLHVVGNINCVCRVLKKYRLYSHAVCEFKEQLSICTP